jgi:hypothetical protein
MLASSKGFRLGALKVLVRHHHRDPDMRNLIAASRVMSFLMDKRGRETLTRAAGSGGMAWRGRQLLAADTLAY